MLFAKEGQGMGLQRSAVCLVGLTIGIDVRCSTQNCFYVTKRSLRIIPFNCIIYFQFSQLHSVGLRIANAKSSFTSCFQILNPPVHPVPSSLAQRLCILKFIQANTYITNHSVNK